MIKKDIRLTPQQLAKHMEFTLFWHDIFKLDVSDDLSDFRWDLLERACMIPSTSVFMLPEFQDHMDFRFCEAYCIVLYKNTYVIKLMSELQTIAQEKDPDRLFNILNMIAKLSCHYKTPKL